MISPARQAAFEILQKIEIEKAYSSVLLPVYEEKLSVRDRALTHELTLGVLRNRIYLDRIVQSFVKTKLEKFDSAVLVALRLALYQLVFLDKIPASAAINESVNLVHRAKLRSATGLVNAILRRAAHQKQFNFQFADETERICVENSHPRWLIERWIKHFGFNETESLVRANNQTPNLTFRLTRRSDDKTIEILKKLGLEIAESKILPNAWQVSKSNEMLRAFAREGKIYFQEESSQLIGQAVSLRNGESFLDVCAAPGSTTTYINYELRIMNYELPIQVAGDKYLHRLRVLRETCQRVGAENVSIVAYDAETALPFRDESFDFVLVDAPCSGTGTIRNNPEIRYFLSAPDLLELPAKQLKILRNASKALKKGGRLVYSTCSLEIEENERVVEKFLAENKNFRKVSPNLPVQFLTAEGFAQTFPQRDETDGFFIAELREGF